VCAPSWPPLDSIIWHLCASLQPSALTMTWNIAMPRPVARPPSIHSPKSPVASFTTRASNMSSPTSPVPMTTSTRSLSFGSFASHQKPIKYGKGRHSDVELVPQPSDDPEDPLVCRLCFILILTASRS